MAVWSVLSRIDPARAVDRHIDSARRDHVSPAPCSTRRRGLTAFGKPVLLFFKLFMLDAAACGILDAVVEKKSCFALF